LHPWETVAPLPRSRIPLGAPGVSITSPRGKKNPLREAAEPGWAKKTFRKDLRRKVS